MPSSSFIHLRVHSAYSLAEGAVKTVEDKPKDGLKAPRKDLIKLCLKHDMPAVAVTDKGNLFGALEFAQAAAEAGIQPITGCQIAVLRPEQATLKSMQREHFDQLVLLAQNEQGYRNLSALVTFSFIEKDRPYPYITADELTRHTEGLIALSAGGDGEIGRLLLAGQKPAADEAAQKYAGLFPGRFYIEINRHPGSPVAAACQRIESDLIDLAYAHDIPLVATNDVYFGEADMYDAHDALLCIADKTIIAASPRRRLSADYCFKSAAEMRTLFADLPEACDNTLVIAKRCAYMPPLRKPILPAFPTRQGRSEEEELRAEAKAGLAARLATDAVPDVKLYEDRLDFELDVIIKMGFAGYFLIVSDFIKWSKQNGIAVGPGRGSGAGSLVAWSLLITDLDPIKFGLIFERFLNPERVSMPDFDIDFCQERRDEVITYVQQKYGADRVAQIITFGKLQARAALRDVGRVLAMPYGYVDKICKLVPNNPAHPVTLGQAIDGEPQLQQMRDGDPTVAQMMDIALKLEGLYRNASTHAAGVVIGDRPLVELVPLYRDPDATLPATQFNMKTVELAGLVKFDFLGLKTLDVLQMTVELLQHRGIPIDLNRLPLDDAKTFSLLAKADTLGVFQLESSGMRDNLRKLKPTRFEDIIAMNALYRPGPMDSIPQYIRCKNGEEKVTYPHPMLEPILKDTFGVFTYQEQVMKAAQDLAGYSLGGADLLRRAMGKKKASEMQAQRAHFLAGAAKNQIEEDKANLIFDLMEKFSGYGFNKSHSAPYAMVAYQTAYLKANYPAEFFAASMNFEIGDTDKLNLFRQELARHRIPLLPPDINRSFPTFAVEEVNGKGAIRYALAAIKGVGMAAMQSVVATRQSGPFKDLFDFAERIDPQSANRRQLENLACAGAFDSLMGRDGPAPGASAPLATATAGPKSGRDCSAPGTSVPLATATASSRHRAQIMASVDTLIRHSQQTHAERSSGQANMFSAAHSVSRPPLPAAKSWDELTRLSHEFDALGFYMSAHPMDNYKAILDRIGAIGSHQVASKQRPGGPNRFKLAGIVVSKQERTSKQGNRFAFVQLSDGGGAFEVTIFSELLAAKRDILETGQAVLVEVDAQSNIQGGGASKGEGAGAPPDFRFIARMIEPLAEASARAARGIRIKLYESAPVPEISKILDSLPKGRAQVVLALDLDGSEEAEIDLQGGWNLDEAAKNILRQIGGGLEVVEY